MVYIGSDGKVNERKKIWRWSLLRDIFYGIYDFVALFLRAVIHPPAVTNGVRAKCVNVMVELLLQTFIYIYIMYYASH